MVAAREASRLSRLETIITVVATPLVVTIIMGAEPEASRLSRLETMTTMEVATPVAMTNSTD
jgi:hypothetical protein